MSLPNPGNGGDAGFKSFALIDALGELLINKNIITQQDWGAVLSTAAARLQAANNSEANRAGKSLQQSIQP